MPNTRGSGKQEKKIDWRRKSGWKGEDKDKNLVKTGRKEEEEEESETKRNQRQGGR